MTAMEDYILFQVMDEITDLINESTESEPSEESSNEDTEWENCSIVFLNNMNKNRVPRLQNYVEKIIPMYTNEMFKSHFRMLPSTFMYILRLIEPSLMRQKSGFKMIPPKKQFLIAIWKMATPDSYRSICEKFDVSRPTALLSVRRVSNALARLASTFIVWPEGDKVTDVFQGFAATSTFPRAIGAIDGTHINIRAPTLNPESYVDRKGHHSIQLQAVCDHRSRFTHCYAGHVGSVHDQRVFRLSHVSRYLEMPGKFPEDSHLLGDAAYALHRHLMTPYRDNGHLTDRQKNYNFCHSSARMAIERAFGLLKGRFRSLLTVLDMQRTDLIPKYIIACCVLHNVCIMKTEELPAFLVDAEREILNDHAHDRPAVTGGEKRDRICADLTMRVV